MQLFQPIVLDVWRDRGEVLPSYDAS